MKPALRKVACPQCGHAALYAAENPYRPFCSERCKLIDMGAWASEQYRIPAAESDAEDLESGGAPDAPKPGN